MKIQNGFKINTCKEECYSFDLINIIMPTMYSHVFHLYDKLSYNFLNSTFPIIIAEIANIFL